MINLVRGAVVGAIALGGLMMASAETSAMPVDGLQPAVSTAASGSTAIQPVYWRRYGYGYGWRRPFFYGYRRPFFGYRRPFVYGYRRPFYGYRRFY